MSNLQMINPYCLLIRSWETSVEMCYLTMCIIVETLVAILAERETWYRIGIACLIEPRLIYLIMNTLFAIWSIN